MDSKWLEKPIGEDMEAKIKTVLKLEQTDQLPPEAIYTYWRIAEIARRLGSPVNDYMLILLGLHLNVDPEEENEKSFAVVVKKHKINPGTEVCARFKNQWRWGRYRKIDRRDQKVYVELDDDEADVRRFQYTSVRLPTQRDRELRGEA
jgi:hypothetical protein